MDDNRIDAARPILMMLLETSRIQELLPNGLQVEGNSRLSTLVTGFGKPGIGCAAWAKNAMRYWTSWLFAGENANGHRDWKYRRFKTLLAA